NLRVAYFGSGGRRGGGLLGARRHDEAAPARHAVRPRRPDAVRADGDDGNVPPGHEQAPRRPRSSGPRRLDPARPREAPLPQLGADRRHRGAVDRQVRARPGHHVGGSQARTGARTMTDEPVFVYETTIVTTPERLWEALTSG